MRPFDAVGEVRRGQSTGRARNPTDAGSQELLEGCRLNRQLFQRVLSLRVHLFSL